MKYAHYYTGPLDEKLVHKASAYFTRLIDASKDSAYLAPESFLALPYDMKHLDYVKKTLAPFVSSRLKYVFVAGIGGSSLGARALQKAFAYDPEHTQRAHIIFLENCEESFLKVTSGLVSSLANSDEFVFLFISKSGKTLETTANADVLTRLLEEKFGDIDKRIVLVTDDNSALALFGKKKSLTTLVIPPPVGGRFSVFSAAGLAPLILAGFNVDALVRGAQKALHMKTHGLPSALISALYALREALKGKAVRDTFVFDSSLEDLGKWYRQLSAESLGKRVKELPSPAGFIPTVSVGTEDLHSIGQRYFGGLANFFTTFVSVEKLDKGDYETGAFSLALARVETRNINRISMAFYDGVKDSYKEAKIPFDECVLEGLSLEEVGCFMQFKMLETLIIAHCSDSNAFNQPNVEGYKTKARERLA